MADLRATWLVTGAAGFIGSNLLELFNLLGQALERHQVHYGLDPVIRDFRPGDVRYSLADIGKARRLLGYAPTHRIGQGIDEAMPWYLDFFRTAGAAA